MTINPIEQPEYAAVFGISARLLQLRYRLHSASHGSEGEENEEIKQLKSQIKELQYNRTKSEADFTKTDPYI